MKIATALKLIEKREREKRQREKVIRRYSRNNNSSHVGKEIELDEPKNLVHVQSIFPKDDIAALKTKTGEEFVKEAIATAVQFFLIHAPEPVKLVAANNGISQQSGGEL